MAAEIQGSPRSNCLVDIAGVANAGMALGRCALVFELSHSDVICLLVALHVGMTRISDGRSYSYVATSSFRQSGQYSAVYSDATGDLPPRKSEKTRVKETLEKSPS